MPPVPSPKGSPRQAILGGCGRQRGPTFLGDPLHQHVQLVDEELLLALHQAGEADAEGGRDTAGVVAPAALQLLRRHLADQRPQLGDVCRGGRTKSPPAAATPGGAQHPPSQGSTATVPSLIPAAHDHPAPPSLLWRKETISSTGRKPHKPSKGVRAMAISGLWLVSG